MKGWKWIVGVVWGTLVITDMIIFQVLGFDVFNPYNRVLWQIELANQGNLLAGISLVVSILIFVLGAFVFTIWGHYVFIDQGWRKELGENK